MRHHTNRKVAADTESNEAHIDKLLMPSHSDDLINPFMFRLFSRPFGISLWCAFIVTPDRVNYSRWKKFFFEIELRAISIHFFLAFASVKRKTFFVDFFRCKPLWCRKTDSSWLNFIDLIFFFTLKIIKKREKMKKL